ncbi:MAG: hypothetical protein D6732_03980 [Methanobacteriota archaeon]|nr:MAG: hypothetical protein D6732_03980 [Euryarchaeota archaeon]
MKQSAFIAGIALPMTFLGWLWLSTGSIWYAFQRIAEMIVRVRPNYESSGAWMLTFLIPVSMSLSVLLKLPQWRQQALQASNFLFGLTIGMVTIFFLLNINFFMEAVQYFPFVLGSLLLFPTGIWGWEAWKSKDKGNIVRMIIVTSLMLVLITPSLVARIAPAPSPGLTETEFGKYEVERFQLDNDFNKTIRELAVPENTGNNWFTFVYVPHPIPVKIPIFIFLHGHGGTDPKYYDQTMRQIASRGFFGIYVQYPTTFDKKIEALADQEYPELKEKPKIIKENPYRYRIVWEGIETVIGSILQETSEIGMGSDNLDLTRVMIAGHSLGGGMVPFIATKVIEQGWANGSLALDIEAGWVDTLKGNMTKLPNETVANVVFYDRDNVVPGCLTAHLFERIRSRDGKGVLQNVSFITVQTDFHGFPRELANHYTPTDLIQGVLYHQAFLSRLIGMAEFLLGKGGLSPILENTDLGTWTDGVRIKPLLRTTDPFGIRGEIGLSKVSVYFDHPVCN